VTNYTELNICRSLYVRWVCTSTASVSDHNRHTAFYGATPNRNPDHNPNYNPLQSMWRMSYDYVDHALVYNA